MKLAPLVVSSQENIYMFTYVSASCLNIGFNKPVSILLSTNLKILHLNQVIKAWFMWLDGKQEINAVLDAAAQLH